MLEEAVEYVAIDSPAAAHRLATALVAAAESLSEFAERGRIVPEINDSRYRELLVGNYRLVYRVDDQRVAIVGLVHGARDFRSWWNHYRQERPLN